MEGPLAFFLCAASVAGDSCAVSSVVLHCEARCAGVNVTSYASADPSSPFPLPHPSTSSERTASGGVLQEPVFAELSSDPVIPTNGAGAESNSDAVQEALTPDQLIALVGPVHRIQWQPVRSTSFGCFDGRYANGGMFTHGADFAELLLGLTAYEHMTQKQLSQFETSELFTHWLARSEHVFAMCTDAAAVEQLALAVGAPESLDLSRPQLEYRASLMLRLVSPEFVGCEHTKRMLLYPETYAVRKTLVEQMLRAFYDVLWNEYHPMHARLTLHSLSGAHAERAVVTVRSSHWCWAEQGLAPLLASRTRSGNAFILSADAITLRRDDIINFLSTQVSPPVAAVELQKRMKALGEGQAQLTEKALTGLLRTYSLLLR